jgi:hypothetical protein
MRLALLDRNAENVLSVLLIGLATFLFREVWASVQVLERIFKALLEGAIFTEGPPIVGVEQYLLLCLCSAAWFLLVFAFLVSRRYYPLWFVQFSFILTPIWVVFFGFFKERADYEFTTLQHFLVYEFLPSGNIFWFIISIGAAVFGVRHCRVMRKAKMVGKLDR